MEIIQGIGIIKNALSVELCKDIINIFESSDVQCDVGEATTLGGVQKKILNAKSIYSMDIDHTDWPRIQDFIEKNTISKVRKYLDNLAEVVLCKQPEFYFFDSITWKCFSVNKYSAKESAGYTYHTDRHVLIETDEERIITFIYYLQDVETGGETDFPGQGVTVKPEAGKLVFFPATWNYPHCSKPTISNDKYIMVGWFLAKHYRKADDPLYCKDNDPHAGIVA